MTKSLCRIFSQTKSLVLAFAALQLPARTRPCFHAQHAAHVGLTGLRPSRPCHGLVRCSPCSLIGLSHDRLPNLGRLNHTPIGPSWALARLAQASHAWVLLATLPMATLPWDSCCCTTDLSLTSACTTRQPICSHQVLRNMPPLL